MNDKRNKRGEELCKAAQEWAKSYGSAIVILRDEKAGGTFCLVSADAEAVSGSIFKLMESNPEICRWVFAAALGTGFMMIPQHEINEMYQRASELWELRAAGATPEEIAKHFAEKTEK